MDWLYALASNAPKLTGAACVGRHEVFDRRDTAEALRIFQACPALQLCGEYYATHSRPAGMVVGGQLPPKRQSQISSTDRWLAAWRKRTAAAQAQKRPVRRPRVNAQPQTAASR